MIQDKFHSMKSDGVKLCHIPTCLSVVGLDAEINVMLHDLKWLDACKLVHSEEIVQRVPSVAPPAESQIQLHLSMEVLTYKLRHIAGPKAELDAVKSSLEESMLTNKKGKRKKNIKA